MKKIIVFSFGLLLFCSVGWTQPYLNFNGSSDYIPIPQLNYSGSLSQVTAEAWINTSFVGSSYNDNWAIIDFDRSEYFDLYVRGDNGQVGFSTNAGGIDDFNSGAGHSVNDGQWHHIAGVYDGTDKIIYIDGVEVARNTNAHGGAALSGSGRWGFIGDGSEATGYDGGRNNIYYDGQIDEPRIWNVALSQSTISTWMSIPLSTSHPDFAHLDYSPTVLDFDGNNDYVTAGDVDALDAPTTFTVEMWFNRRSDQYSSTNSNHNIGNVLIAQSSDGSNDNLEMGTNGSNIEIYVDAGSGSEDAKYSFPAGIQNNTWYHLAFTYDGNATPAAKIYLNGGLVAEESNWIGALDNSDASPLTFGIARGGSSNWGDFDGQIDDIRIWDTALDQSTIQHYLYMGVNSTHPNYANLLIYYPIYLTGTSSTTGGSTTTVPDVDGSITANGTMVNMNASANRVTESSFGIPTLSEWGVIILFLLTFSMVIVASRKREFILAGQNIHFFNPFQETGWNKKLFFTILKITVPAAILGFLAVHIISGSNGILDFVGTIVCTVIVSYNIMLFMDKENG